jgi:putative tryptophan/tyrosine transport system substrate-binding protein
MAPLPLPAWASEALRQGLRDVGYVEGQNLVIETRSADNQPERVPQLIAEFAKLKIDVIVTPSTPTTLAAKRATATIPIVMALVGDPVRLGLVDSLAQPGGNVTGMSIVGPEMFVKSVEFLKEAAPRVSRLVEFRNPNNPAHDSRNYKPDVAVPNVAAPRSVTRYAVNVGSSSDLDGAFAAAVREHADALLIHPLAIPQADVRKIAEFAVRNHLPTITNNRTYVADLGLLISYSASFVEQLRRVGIFVDKILKGAKPANLPVEQPTKFELVINLKTAKALGLTIPPSLLLRADQVID